MPFLFLFASMWWFGLTLNALWPVRRHRHFIVQSFVAGWLVGEAPLHHLAFELLCTLCFVALGGLLLPIGLIALGLSALSWLGLLYLYAEASKTKHVVERALLDAFGATYRTLLRSDIQLDVMLPAIRFLLPLWFRDPSVRVVRNLTYGPGSGARKLDIYMPTHDVERAPVLFQIHGGGWITGHKAQQARPLLHYMAARGWICVSINYRLSPRHKWPAHLIDCKLALAWVKDHIHEYGGDPSFVVCTGGSAGGHLCAMVALTPGDPALQPEAPNADTSVAACVPLYGIYDFADRGKLHMNLGLRGLLERVIIQQPFESARDVYEAASPISHLSASAPPFFVIHGTHDSLTAVEEARAFVAQLRAVSKAPVAYAELSYAQHAFEWFYSRRSLHVIRAVHRFAEAVYAQQRGTALPAESESAALSEPAS